MRISRGIAALLLATLVAGSLAGCSGEGGGGSLLGGSEEAVATVNGIDIPRSELDAMYQQVVNNAGGELDEETALAYKRQLLQMMIDAALITEAAEELGADLSEDAVEERLTQLRGTQDEAAFEAQLEEAGLDMDNARKSVRDMLAQEFIQVVASAESSITTLPETYSRLSHILVSDEALANDLAEQARGGADFAALASANSSDTASAVDGGNLGWGQTSRYVAAFADAASALKVGEVSDPVKSEFGWHVILKQEEAAEGTPIADIPAELAALIEQDTGTLAMQAYVAKLREDAEIEYLDETLKPVE